MHCSGLLISLAFISFSRFMNPHQPHQTRRPQQVPVMSPPHPPAWCPPPPRRKATTICLLRQRCTTTTATATVTAVYRPISVSGMCRTGNSATHTQNEQLRKTARRKRGQSGQACKKEPMYRLHERSYDKRQGANGEAAQ